MWHFQCTPFMTESVCNNVCFLYEKKSNIRKNVWKMSIENTYYLKKIYDIFVKLFGIYIS